MFKVDGGNYGDKLAMLPADGHLPGKFYYKMPLQHLPSSSKEARITAKALLSYHCAFQLFTVDVF